tara:strand:- start:79 stop:471 length:393 start_codon:yes stop_codon:yes gene_type:complete
MILINETDKKNLLIDNLSKKIKSHFGNLINEGFEFDNYWITCKRSQQDDLMKLITAIGMFGAKEGTYRCYTYIDNKKSKEKSDITFSIAKLKEIFKSGSIFIKTKVQEEAKMLKKIKSLKVLDLENFKIC